MYHVSACIYTGFDTGCFQHRFTDLVTPSWASRNLILSKTDAAIKPNSSFLTKTPT